MEEGYKYDSEKKVWICNKCNKVSKTKRDIKDHLNRKKTCVNINKFTCDKCKRVFSLKKDYNKHLERKTDCTKDLNAPLNNITQLANIITFEDKVTLEKLEDKEKINSLQKEVELQKNSTSQELEKENLLLKKKVTLLEKDVEDLTENYTDAVHKYFNVHMISKSKNFDGMSYYFFRTNIDVHYEQFSYFMDHVKSEQLYSVNYKIHHIEFKEKQEKLVQFLKQYIEELQKSEKHTLYGKEISFIIHQLSIDPFELDKEFGKFIIK